MADLIRELSEKDVFSHFSSDVLAQLGDYSLSRRLEEGEHLCCQGEVWPYVVYLAEGQLNWSMVSSGGKEHLLFKVKSRDVFWAHSIFDDQPMPASLSAADRVLAYIWPRDTILPLLMKYPRAMWDIPKILTGTMRNAREIIYGLAFQPVASRLAGYILDNLESSGQSSFSRDMTLEEIATVLATSAEVVCRLLYQFQTDGILKITRTQISLEDQLALEKLRSLS